MVILVNDSDFWFPIWSKRYFRLNGISAKCCWLRGKLKYYTLVCKVYTVYCMLYIDFVSAFYYFVFSTIVFPLKIYLYILNQSELFKQHNNCVPVEKLMFIQTFPMSSRSLIYIRSPWETNSIIIFHIRGDEKSTVRF